MARSEHDKERLKEMAKKLIAEKDDVEIAADETTGENDFKYEKSPKVCAVVVDKNSGRGFAQITGGGKPTEIIHTGRGESGFIKVDIMAGQSCMLYGQPTVLYICPTLRARRGTGDATVNQGT